MLKFLLTFSAGIYTGIYISQNYEVPRVDEPSKIIDKIKELADEHRKKSPAEQLLHDVKKGAKKIVD
ncbi:short transmembrane mitochondrial protein 1 [Musca domestica]|uniref:Short transmembrane mitochondrial protein 1 n=1 Tax=Musca domestica TaxID=7370 RepID=A0A1I8N5A7_MUSDO|nr:short transmembrane mitochondrial protein 1 [Musca domestica]XP_058980173.1 short transmembrane mitochondrial protein 1 [Musca domestica]